jgi:haloalkane dehalogenase
MILASETFDGTFPFKPNFSAAPGFRMHYVDEGDGEPIVCLHGEPTWGYLYRDFIFALAQGNRVVVPDHMGFGKSETPQNREYTLQTHVENLAALIDDLKLEQITFVGQDWGGPIMGAYTIRHPQRVKRLCLMNTMLGYGAAVPNASVPQARPPKLTSSDWFQWVLKSLDDGSYRDTMEHLDQHIVEIMRKLGIRDVDSKGAAWRRAYATPFDSPEECKGAVEFPIDAAKGRIAEYVKQGLGGLEALRAKSAMLTEGLADRAMPPELVMADFKALFPDGPMVKLPDVGHYCQEDAPETLVALIQLFIQMT